jgi:flagellin-like hook-associated protein FlgL
MSLVVTSNIAGLNSQRNLSIADRQQTTSLERLSSGHRINRAADDASNLAISEGLRAQIGGFKVALRNSQDGISVLQTAEAALTETQGILHRMRDLAVQAANTGGLAAEAKANIQSEVGQLTSELDRIADTTTFNGKKLLDGSYRTLFQVGGDASHTIAVDIGDLGAAGLGVAGVDVTGVGRYGFDPAVGTPAAGRASISTAASAGTAAVLTLAAPAGSPGFSGSAADLSSYDGLDGTVSVGGHSFDLASVSYDRTADTDGNGSADGADLLAQLNRAATAALGLASPPFTSPAASTLAFSVSDALAGYTGAAGRPLSGSAADQARATPSFSAAGGAPGAISVIDAAINRVSGVRGELGAVQNRLEHNIAKLGAALDNTAASESRIRDTDMASEMTAFSRTQILTQAGTAMLAQANQAPRTVLKLLG